MLSDDPVFQPLKDYLANVPGVRDVSSGFSDDGCWWVKFTIDIEHPLAWSVVQELGHVLNYVSLEERLPTVFMPVSPPPYMNGGPREFLSWVIESKSKDFQPKQCAEWLEGRLPRPVTDIEQWRTADDDGSSEELLPGYEQVFTVVDYFDGPVKGVANFEGRPHFYERIFDEAKEEYSDVYRLTPLSEHLFILAKEDWDIWKRWQNAFHAGKATVESQPALPFDRARHEEIRAVLEHSLTTNMEICVTQHGSFERLGGEYPKGVVRPLQVRWTTSG